jgi:hypothetical protein
MEEMMKSPTTFVDIMYIGYESDAPEIRTRNGDDVLLITEVDYSRNIEDEQGNKGWSVICEDEVGYDCFWSEKLQMYVYALDQGLDHERRPTSGEVAGDGGGSMTQAELERVVAARTASVEEYEAALAAARSQLPNEVEGNCASAVEVAVEAAHRADAHRIVAALEAALGVYGEGSQFVGTVILERRARATFAAVLTEEGK